MKNNINHTTADLEVPSWDNVNNPKIISNTNGISSKHHRNGSLPLPTLVTSNAQNKCNDFPRNSKLKKRKTVVEFHTADLTQCMSLQTTPQLTTKNDNQK